MSEARRITDGIERAVSGPVWHGPALAELLAGVTAAMACERPIAGAHTIWELVLHLTSWAEIVRARLVAGAPGDPLADEDWPPAPREATDEAWRRAVAALEASHVALARKAATLDDAALDATVPGRDYTVAVMLRGVAEHGAYHGGQIAIIKRALSVEPLTASPG
ncbi:MAG TPA: DinB family protein [Gemmatimonadales bacterium]